MKKVNRERQESTAEPSKSTANRKRGQSSVASADPAAIPAAKKSKTYDTASAVPAVTAVVPKPVTDPSRHANTVFLSNLDFGVAEDDIRTAMAASGTVTDVRLVRDYKQRSKGYCYVEFSSNVFIFQIFPAKI